MLNESAMLFGVSMMMVDYRDLTAPLKQLVAVRFVVAVETPDAAQHRRAAR